MRRAKRWDVALVVALSAAWSCIDATDVDLLQVSATGVLFGQAYLDRNGNAAPDASDAPLRNASVVLASPATQDVVSQATTDSLGIFVLEDVPVGSYTLRLAAAVLGDSLVALGTGGTVTVELGDTTLVILGATYPELSLAEVRAAVPGRRVFMSAIALNPRQANGDGVVFFKGPTSYLRATNVDRAGLGIGDSVRILGRTALSNGQPTLDVVTPYVLISLAQLAVPVEVTTAAAASAGSGALDAALVRIRNAEIRDTSTVSDDFYFWAHNGGDSVEVVFRAFLGISKASVRPDTVVRVSEATGMLSPFDDGSGTLRWRLLVRAASEIGYLVKSANVGVTTSFDTLLASAPDTVEIRVTVSNLGPQTATSVAVADTIPAALTFVSATATRGSYDLATRTWTVGDLAAGATPDTLRILAEVTGPAGPVTNTARLLPLLREVEVNAGNNVATTQTLTIQ
jgi:uncharacterized repeat protein (TIGR01451 family)